MDDIFDAFDWHEISSAFSWIAAESPLLLAYLLGIVLALMNWRRYPRVAMLTLFVCVSFFLESLIMPFVWRLASRVLVNQGGGGANIEVVLRLVSFGQAIINGGLWLLLLIAMFRWRGQPRRIRGPDGQYLPEDFPLTGASGK